METYQVGLIALAVFAVLWIVAARSWRTKIRVQDQKYPQPTVIPFSESGIECFYVATTVANRPLDRVLAHGLAHRGRAYILVSEDKLSISRKGERSFAISGSDILALEKATAVIDKAVERDGLTVLSWRLGEHEVQTHLRFPASSNRTVFIGQIEALMGVSR
jgi:hypothetical protein